MISLATNYLLGNEGTPSLFTSTLEKRRATPECTALFIPDIFSCWPAFMIHYSLPLTDSQSMYSTSRYCSVECELIYVKRTRRSICKLLRCVHFASGAGCKGRRQRHYFDCFLRTFVISIIINAVINEDNDMFNFFNNGSWVMYFCTIKYYKFSTVWISSAKWSGTRLESQPRIRLYLSLVVHPDHRNWTPPVETPA